MQLLSRSLQQHKHNKLARNEECVIRIHTEACSSVRLTFLFGGMSAAAACTLAAVTCGAWSFTMSASSCGTAVAVSPCNSHFLYVDVAASMFYTDFEAAVAQQPLACKQAMCGSSSF